MVKDLKGEFAKTLHNYFQEHLRSYSKKVKGKWSAYAWEIKEQVKGRESKGKWIICTNKKKAGQTDTNTYRVASLQ